jgi:hypothetical protein
LALSRRAGNLVQISHQIVATFTVDSLAIANIPHRYHPGGDRTLEATMNQSLIVKVPTSRIADTGKVRIGGTSPSLPPAGTAPTSVADNGKVRIGGTSPSLPPAGTAPARVADNGKVRIGGTSPSLPR